MKPRIAIPVPTSGDVAYNHLNWGAYAEAVVMCGGVPIRMELRGADTQPALSVDEYDGILLPGSPADVQPLLYGQAREEATADEDSAREWTDRRLLEEGWESGKPLMAVCFGMQMMNVWRGGTLIQDLAPVPVNHSAGRSVAAAHAISVDGHSHLARLSDVGTVGEPPTLVRDVVNSSHHQAVGLVGSGLRVVARADEDGVVEGIERGESGAFFLGVQWHPERTLATSRSSRKLFEALIGASTIFAAKR